ncbi:hypothetical protein J5N97_020945 [Dioscorea zingiberensis]|uniref:Disease resistance N-terminal domain-containing protein n=1 Tax=Dioscorea zingiberensis TaxID=325984 RepID=A0A9D5CGS1_9LILI|nr:hypothetical protein J5N97_020945 [Dioscorea zingiberensis]
MAVEAAIASSLSLIVELSVPHVLEYLGPLWHGVDDELHKLRRAMLGIRSIIGDAEERQVEDRTVKDWLTELKHAAYDAEDVLDQANTHLLVLRRKSELHGHLTSKLLEEDMKTGRSFFRWWPQPILTTGWRNGNLFLVKAIKKMCSRREEDEECERDFKAF